MYNLHQYMFAICHSTESIWKQAVIFLSMMSEDKNLMKMKINSNGEIFNFIFVWNRFSII